METFMQYSDLLLRLVNIIVIGYGLYGFLRKPHNDLEERVKNLEVKVKEHADSLNRDDDKFKDIFMSIKLINNVLIALVEFEGDYCIKHGGESISTKLQKAQDELYDFLADRG